MASGVASVYLHVVDDVVSKVREEFLNFGVGENILNELQGAILSLLLDSPRFLFNWCCRSLVDSDPQFLTFLQGEFSVEISLAPADFLEFNSLLGDFQLWEMKMMQCGAISEIAERPAPKANGVIAPVHDLNVPYEGPTEEYETPTAEMLFPPTPLQTPIPTPLPGILENHMYHTGTPNDFDSTEDTRDVETKVGRPNPYMMPPSPWMTQRPLGVDVNIAYDEVQDDANRGAPHQPRTQDFFMGSSGKRKRGDYPSHLPPDGFIPQQDGASDVIFEFILPEGKDIQKDFLSPQEYHLPQLDGVNDEYGSPLNAHGDGREGYLTPPSENVGTPRVVLPTGSGDGDEPPLNEDDDDEEDDFDDLDQEEEEPNTQHLVLALFDKVTRAKNRWKCMLKDGIMHLNNRDILFNKANGEFEF